MNDEKPSTTNVAPVSEKDVVVLQAVTAVSTTASTTVETHTAADVPAVADVPVVAASTVVPASVVVPAAASVVAAAVPAAAVPAAVVQTVPSSITDISGALAGLIAKAQTDLSGAVPTNAFLLSLVPRFAAAVHSYKTSGQEKKKVVVAALHSLICLVVPPADQDELHRNVDAFVPFVLDALIEVVKGDVVFPKQAKENWFVRGLLCCLAAKTK